MNKRRGVAMGAGAGLVIGAVFHNPGTGLVLGAAAGFVFPALLERLRDR